LSLSFSAVYVLSRILSQDEERGEECLLAVAGGGAWEIALIRQLETYVSGGGFVR